MKFKKGLYILYLLPLIFFFLPAFAFILPGSPLAIKFFFTSVCLIAIYIIKNNFFALKNIIKIMYKNTPLKYLFIVLGLISINTILKIFFRVENWQIGLSSIVMQIIFGIVTMIIYFTYLIKRHLQFEQFIKIFIFMLWLDLVLGITSWLCAMYDIKLILNIFDFFSNTRVLNLTKAGYDSISHMTHFYAFGLPRLNGFYEEPGWYARFIFLFLPIIYAFGNTNLKLYKNKYLNKIIKVSLIPLTWISLILTFSPIFLVLSIILTIVLYIKKIIKYFKYLIIPLFLLFVVIYIVILNIDLSNTYLSRIVNVLTKIRSFEDFILVEPSLATRFVCYINSIIIFLKNPLTGIGLGNLDYIMIPQLLNSPVLLTPEIKSKLECAMLLGTNFHTNLGFIYRFLAEHGIIIFSIFVFFVSRLMKNINFIMHRKKYLTKFQYTSAKALYGCLIAIIILSFYELYFTEPEMYLIFIWSLIFIDEYKLRILQKMEEIEYVYKEVPSK